MLPVQNDDNMLNDERKRSGSKRNVRGAGDTTLDEVVIDASLCVEVLDRRRMPFLKSPAIPNGNHE